MYPALGGIPCFFWASLAKKRQARKKSYNYYPFGLTFNSWKADNSTENRFLYTGKERINDLNLGWDDFWARIYMPEIGRWGVVDPMSHKFVNYTPYNYAINNPNGMESYKYDWESKRYENEKGEEVDWGIVHQEIQNKSEGTNVLVTSKNRTKKGNIDWALEGVVLQAKASSFKIFEVDHSKDAYDQLKEFVDSGGKIGNVIFDSHGTYRRASFRIGNGSRIYSPTNAWTIKIGELFSENTEVLLLACHAGAAHNQGTELLSGLSNAWGVTVYGSQSWTAPKPGMFIGVVSPGYADFENKATRPKAWNNRWKWTVAKGGVSSNTEGSLYIKINGAFEIRKPTKVVEPRNGWQRFGEL